MYEEEHLPTGTIIDGKYELEHPIGVGGMGAVYFAIQKDLGRRVAIKLLHPHFRSNADVIERFHREARLAASIGHDNICEVTDFGTHTDGSPFLVMPVLKGASLADVLREEKLDINRTCDIMRQVLSALDAAHIAGVVHRDLKPDNIFISQMGDRKDFVKLLDFGISKVMESGLGTELTRTGTVMGTPVYMAPEQARGEKKVDHRLDIYAAGVIMYEALTGKRPHDGESYNEIVFKIIAEPFPPPRSLNPQIPKKLEKVVVKAMAKNPADRFSGAKEMGEAIAKVVDVSLSRGLSSGSLPAAVRQPVKRERTLLIPLLIVLVILIAGGVLAVVFYMKKGPGNAPTYVNITNRPALPADGKLAASASEDGVPRVDLNDVISSPSEGAEAKMANSGKPQEEVNEIASSQKTDSKASGKESGSEKSAAKSESSKKSKDAHKTKKDDSERGQRASSDESNSSGPASSAPSNATLPVVAEVPTPQPSPPPSDAKNYTNMNQLKAALGRGEITQDAYRAGQADIQARRAAEIERLKADYRAGRIDKSTYNLRANQIKYKFETGRISGPPAPAVAAPPAAVAPPQVVSYTNMRQLKAALRSGRITREQYTAHQAKIRARRAIEYEQIKQAYKAGKMTRSQYKQRISAARRKYEGD